MFCTSWVTVSFNSSSKAKSSQLDLMELQILGIVRTHNIKYNSKTHKNTKSSIPQSPARGVLVFLQRFGPWQYLHTNIINDLVINLQIWDLTFGTWSETYRKITQLQNIMGAFSHKRYTSGMRKFEIFLQTKVSVQTDCSVPCYLSA